MAPLSRDQKSYSGEPVLSGLIFGPAKQALPERRSLSKGCDRGAEFLGGLVSIFRLLGEQAVHKPFELKRPVR